MVSLGAERVTRVFVLMVAVGALGGCPDPAMEEVGPVAAFSAAPTAGAPGVVVQFSDESATGSAGIAEWYWNFGDGATSGEQDPAHVYPAEGVYTVALTVTTAVGSDTAVEEDLITVTREADVAPPVISLNGPGEVVLECGVAWEDPGATAVDDRDPSVHVLVGGDAVLPELGVYTITYDAVDDWGNRAAQVRRVVRVEDTTPPVIALNGGDVEVECGEGFVDPGAMAVDECDGSIAVESTGSIDPGTLGPQVITYTATDPSGNAAEATRIVTITDTFPPVITLTGGDVRLECGAMYEEPGAMAVDECAREVEVSIDAGGLGSGLGSFDIVYAATDTSGNTAQTRRTVTITDSKPPIISLNGGDITLECGDAYEDPGASAVDECAGEVEVAIDAGGLGGGPGVFAVTYSASDASGNMGTSTRTVTVNDSLPPVIYVEGGDMRLKAGDPFSEPGVSAVDLCEGAVEISVGGDVVDPDVAGVYTLTYNAEDSAGNTAPEQHRRVLVYDDCESAEPWSKFYGDFETRSQVVATDACSLVVAAWSLTRWPEPRVALRKLGAGGEIEWETNHSFVKGRPYHLRLLENGDFLLVGIAYYGDVARQAMEVVRLNSDGSARWSRQYPIAGTSPVSGVGEATDGVLWVARTFDDPEASDGLLLPASELLIIEEGGMLLQTTEIPGLNVVGIADCGGSMVLLGSAGEVGGSESQRKWILVSMNGDGKERWRRALNLDWDLEVTDFVSRLNGGLLAGLHDDRFAAVAIDAEGGINWTYMGSERFYCDSVAAFCDALGETTLISVDDQDYYYEGIQVTKLDGRGVALWTKLNSGLGTAGRDVAATEEGGAGDQFCTPRGAGLLSGSLRDEDRRRRKRAGHRSAGERRLGGSLSVAGRGPRWKRRIYRVWLRIHYGALCSSSRQRGGAAVATPFFCAHQDIDPQAWPRWRDELADMCL